VLEGFPYDSVYSGGRAFRLLHDFQTRVARVNRDLRSLIPTDALNWADIDVKTVSGLVHAAIMEAASDQPTDLIVLGLPRRSRMEELVAGSAVHRVLRHATSPVLLVPGPAAASLNRRAGREDVYFPTHPNAFGLRAAIEPDRPSEGRPA